MPLYVNLFIPLPTWEKKRDENCLCVCSNPISCPQGQHWDENQCRCICSTSTICPSGSRLDLHQCKCINETLLNQICSDNELVQTHGNILSTICSSIENYFVVCPDIQHWDENEHQCTCNTLGCVYLDNYGINSNASVQVISREITSTLKTGSILQMNSPNHVCFQSNGTTINMFVQTYM